MEIWFKSDLKNIIWAQLEVVVRRPASREYLLGFMDCARGLAIALGLTEDRFVSPETYLQIERTGDSQGKTD